VLGKLNKDVHTVHANSLSEWLEAWDIRAESPSDAAIDLFHAAPGGVRTTEAFSTENRWSSLDTDAAGGCIRDVEHAYTADGGLVVLRGNLAEDGAIIKAAGIDEELALRGQGPRRRVPGGRSARNPGKEGLPGRLHRRPLRRPGWWPGHAGDAAPDRLPEGL